jgi:hypothetical protein
MSKKPRWVWIAASVALFAWAPYAAAQSAKFQIEETTIAAVHRAMLRHELSCVELVQQYLSRIEQHNKELRAIIHVNPNALEIARKLDASLASSGTLSGALHCVPVAVKDAIDTAEMPTSGPARLPDLATTAGGSPWFGTAPHNAVSSLARKNAISGRAAVAVILRLFLCQ